MPGRIIYILETAKVNIGKNEMIKFHPYLSKDKTILEFGCGPGKNLFGIANLIRTGYGIDVNPQYIRIAKKLAEKYNFKNLIFLKYDGINFPDIPKVDFIFEKGVFERLHKNQVKSYVEKLKVKLNESGVIILYFLMEKARGTEFTKRLGDSSYVFWDHNEIQIMLKDSGLRIREVIYGKRADYYVCVNQANKIDQFMPS